MSPNARTNCIVVRWVKDALGETQPAYWRGVGALDMNEWVLDYGSAAKLALAEAMVAARARCAEVYSDWGLDTERAQLVQSEVAS